MAEGFASSFNDMKLAGQDVGDAKPSTAARQARGKPRQRRRSNKQPERLVPTHFVAFRLKNHEIAVKLADIQRSVTEEDSTFQKAHVSVAKLHVTVVLLALKDDHVISKAKRALQGLRRRLQDWFAALEGSTVHVKGLGTFDDNVLYARVEDQHQMFDEVAAMLREAFERAGVPVLGSSSDPVKPHVTVMKLVKNAGFFRKRGISQIPVELYNDWTETEFGTEIFDHLILCSMGRQAADGFYNCLANLQFT